MFFLRGTNSKIEGYRNAPVLDRPNFQEPRNQAPLENEGRRLKNRISEIESEIANYVKGLGKGRVSARRLESEIEKGEKDQEALQVQYDDIQRQINEAICWDYDAELMRKHLRDFRAIFGSLTPDERAEALQCILKEIVLYPDRLVLNIYELPELKPGSQNRTVWLPGLDSNLAGGTPPLR